MLYLKFIYLIANRKVCGKKCIWYDRSISFLGAFLQKLQRVTISLVMSVRLFVRTKKREIRRIHFR